MFIFNSAAKLQHFSELNKFSLQFFWAFGRLGVWAFGRLGVLFARTTGLKDFFFIDH